MTASRASIRGAVLGAGGGLCAALADVASTILWLHDPIERVRLVVALVLAGIAAGAWAGAAIAAVVSWRRDPAATWRSDSMRVGAVLAVPLACVAYLLFTGGHARRIPALWVVRPVAWGVMVTSLAIALVLAVRAIRVLRTRSWVARATAALACIAIAQVLHALDHRLLPRLYEYLHAGLGIGTALAFVAAIVVSAPARANEQSMRAAALVSIFIAPVGFVLLDRWDNVRAEVFGVHAPFVRHAALAVEALRPHRGQRTHSSSSIATARVDTRGLASAPGASLLLITIDALRDDRVGRRIDGASLTPHLDALAAAGTRFERTYTAAPHSSYSLTSLHTSEYLHETVPLGQPQPLVTLADRLAREGYYTAAFYTDGIFFTEGERLTSYRERSFGFRRADHVDRRAPAQAEAAMREIDDIARRAASPAFVWVHFFDTHEPYGGAGSTPEAQYDAAVGAVDRAVGELVTHARERLGTNLIVAVTADHGEEFGEHGGVYHGSALYEEQVRVPWIIAGPAVPHVSVHVVAQLVDLAPTLLGMLGVAPEPSMRGDDLRPWIAGRTDATRMAFSAVNTRSLVTDGAHALVVDRRYGVRELYDLARDPHETRNVASDAPAEAARLDTALDAWGDAVGERATGNAVLARGRMGDRGAVEGLLALANDTAAAVALRVEAMRVLAGYDDAHVTAPLTRWLADDSRAIRDGAAIALGRTGIEAARSRLRDAIERDDPAMRERAALALAHMGDRAALPVLIEMLVTADEAERIEAVDALGALRDARALPALDDILADDHVRYRTVLAFGRIGGPFAAARLARIARDDRANDVRANAGAAMALSGDRAAIEPLGRLLRSDGAQLYASSALARLGAAVYDARNDHTRTCAPIDDGPVWRLLAARVCVIENALTLPASAISSPSLLAVRARGHGLLRMFDGDREIAHVALEPVMREWRISLATPPASLTLRGDAPFELAHVVWAP